MIFSNIKNKSSSSISFKLMDGQTDMKKDQETKENAYFFKTTTFLKLINQKFIDLWTLYCITDSRVKFGSYLVGSTLPAKEHRDLENVKKIKQHKSNMRDYILIGTSYFYLKQLLVKLPDTKKKKKNKKKNIQDLLRHCTVERIVLKQVFFYTYILALCVLHE